MKRLLKNKRGQIPATDVVNAILNGIRSFVSWFLATAPKPLLILLFLVFVLLVGNFIMPLLVNAIGYHCDTNYNVWKVSGTAMLVNFDLIKSKPDIDSVNTINIPLLCGGSGIREGTKLIICTNCTSNNETLKLVDQYCISDGYVLPSYDTLLERLNCDWFGCKPPDGYFYNITIDKYLCSEEWCINKTLDDYNNKIYSVEGATPVFRGENSSLFTPEDIIFFKCKENNPTNIRITFFGIDILDYRIWVTLLVVGLLLIFYSQFKK